MNKILRKKRLKRALLGFLIAVSPLPFLGCNGNNHETPLEETPVVRRDIDYRPEGYYNRFPIQIYVDQNFSKVNRDLIKQSIMELDLSLSGVKFEFVDKKPSGYVASYSYINILLDEDGEETISAYEHPANYEAYAFAQSPHNYVTFQKGNYTVSNFVSDITLGSYFTISEDIPDSDKQMGWELQWNNFDKFGAYVDTLPFMDDYHWDFDTTYSAFKERIENALKGVTKHEMGHSLGYATTCEVSDAPHSCDENSLMYYYHNDAMNENVMTDDVVTYFNQKYPDDDNEPNN